MMTLAEITFPVSYEFAANHALLFDGILAARLSQLHAAYGTANCWPIAAVLSDGRHYLHGTVLTEVMPGGLLFSMWEAADKNILFPAVEVVEWSTVAPLLPPQPPFSP